MGACSEQGEGNSLVQHLLWAKWCQLRNLPRSAGGGRSKALLGLLFGLSIWLGIYFGANWFVGKCLEVEPIGELIVEKMLDFVLLILFSMMLFSSVITSFSTFFLADDLQLLMSRPIDPYALYGARFIETLILAGWMPLLFSMPLFVNIGVQFGAGWTFYAVLAVALVSVTLIASAVAVPMTVILTNVLPAQRTRDVMVFLGVLGFVIVFVLFRAINPEQMLQPDKFNNTMELFASLGSPSSSWLPSSWALEALRPALRGDDRMAWLQLGTLVSTAGALFFVGGWVFRRWHGSGFSKALEGRHAGSGLERATGWLSRRKASGPELARRALAKLRSRTGPLNPGVEMMVKDARVFVRDTAQWSQIILLLALVVIYLLNFRYFRTLGEGGIIGPFGLFLMNVGLCGFIVASVGLRFLFPAISLEGKAFWLIITSPQTMQQFVGSKALAGAVPMLVISQLLSLSSNVMIGTPWPLTLVSVVVVATLVLGLSGLGVGIGAMYPRFDGDNASKVATSFGGMLYMMLALALVVAVLAMMAPPTWVLTQLLAGIDPWMLKRRPWLPVLCAAGVFVVPLAVGYGALKLGARKLGRSEG